MATKSTTRRKQQQVKTPHPQSRAVRPDLHEVPPYPDRPLRGDMALTYAEAAAYMRTTPFKVARYVYDGKLPASHVGRVGIVFGEDVRELLERNYRHPSARG